MRNSHSDVTKSHLLFSASVFGAATCAMFAGAYPLAIGLVVAWIVWACL